MRTFIAVPLNDEIHNELARLQNRLRSCGCDVKWVEPSNIHLTLKFLGEIDNERLGKIKTSLSQAAGLHHPFGMRLATLGAFPKISFPQVIWVGIDEGKAECEALYKTVQDAMAGLGFEQEKRPFSPHLTLGRLRSLKNKNKLLEVMEKEKDFACQNKVSADRIIFFQSILTPQGSIYTALAEFSLV